ncbi:MAG: hypothetical protein KY437_10100 [Actinobacteria bacterium]|nr:hypothetical protein [Actinomycetota bacterium]
MVRIVDTLPDFHRFAGMALNTQEADRAQLWEERYRRAHPQVFAAYDRLTGREGPPEAVLGQLAGVRSRVQEAATVVPDLIGEVEPALRDLLDAGAFDEPIHVLLVGGFQANAFVTRLDGEVAVVHCLEWFAGEEPGRVLIAHEDTHALHQLLLGRQPPDDPAWMTFYEGVGIRASRELVPDRPDDDYFWYGLEGFEEWLPWCREHRADLRRGLADRLDDPEATEDFFGGGFVDGRWRTGFFVADEVISGADQSLEELVRLDVDEARALVRRALDA